MKALYILYTNYLILFHNVSFSSKLKLVSLLSLPLSLITSVSQSIQSWFFSNNDYITAVLLCIAIDHTIGTILHALKLKDFSLKKNILGICKKISLCVISAILFETIHYTLKEIPLVYEYLKSVTRLTVLLYPAGSAFINMSILTNGKFPPFGWIKRIQAFNSSLDLDKFKNPDNISS